MKTGTGTTTNNGFAHATAQALVEPVPVFISPELAGCGPVLPPQEDRPEQKTNAERNAYGRQWTTFDLTFDVPDPTFQFLPALAGVDGRRIGDGLRPLLGPSVSTRSPSLGHLAIPLVFARTSSAISFAFWPTSSVTECTIFRLLMYEMHNLNDSQRRTLRLNGVPPRWPIQSNTANLNGKSFRNANRRRRPTSPRSAPTIRLLLACCISRAKGATVVGESDAPYRQRICV